MRVLALDSTTRGGSVGLLDGAQCDERAGDRSRGHAERLPGELLALLPPRGLTLADIDLYAVALGPGSFTGLRIGIATIQGLAFAGRRRVVGVSALEALAVAGERTRDPGALVATWIDAQRHQVYAALYRTSGAGPGEAAAVEIEPAGVGEPAAVLDAWSARTDLRDAVFVGDGAVLHAGLVRERTGAAVEPAPLLAGTIARLAARRAELAVDPGGLMPLYVRRPDAELGREARR